MGARSIRSLVVLTVVLASAAAVEASDRGAARVPSQRPAVLEVEPPAQPNIVLLVTDDQREDTLRYMPIVRRLLGRHGVTFTNGYVVNPVCCPSRSSMLTGLYSHSTGVYTNKPPNGGFSAFDDESTLATWLQAAGYRTGLFGKYLNGYGRTPYVPPGWDRWFATYQGGAYYDYVAVADGEYLTFGSGRRSYGTTVLQDRAVSFIERTDASTPLFLYWAPHAPHEPATPHPADRGTFSSLRGWRPSSYDEADVSDKPRYLSGAPRIDRTTANQIDRFRQLQLESLQSVDRAVGAIVQALRDTDRLENTIIVFTSDNGMLWGEHRWYRKSVPYEEAIGVPFVVRYDAMVENARRDDHLVLNIDLAPTFAAAGGADAPDMEGRSLLPLLQGDDPSWRHAFLIEHLGEGSAGAPTFCAVHTGRYVLASYGTGEEELYDLVRDPKQMVNRAQWTRYREIRRTLRGTLQRLCDPAPAGLDL
jgi:N-acetylglucosamine-6-sulfatase